MIEVDEALQLVREHAVAAEIEAVPLADALHRFLAGPIVSRINSPPYDKALMDGYAVIGSDVQTVPCQLRVLEEVAAGHLPTHTIEPGTCARIMTGALMPDGADTVIPFELSDSPRDAAEVEFGKTIAAGRNVLLTGFCFREGETVAQPGERITAAQIGLFAELGQTSIRAFRQITTSVLATGDELVPVGQPLSTGQIQDSNNPMLTAMAAEVGCEASSLGIGRDNLDDLRSLIAQGLKSDILLLSGGVSAGTRDLIPQVLEELGVQQVFHKVRLKPGKPIWFGKRDGTLVFGLPGNPVSSFVCFQLFVRTAIDAMRGNDLQQSWLPADLATSFVQGSNRPTFFPGRFQVRSDAKNVVEPLPWKGSADLRTIAQANCLIRFPAGPVTYDAGDRTEVMMLK